LNKRPLNQHDVDNSHLPTSKAYKEILLHNTPMIDVRAPMEFAKGALPGAVNLPFINDQERHLIGLCYKEKGQQAAINLGHQLVAGDIKKQRVMAWEQFLDKHPNALIYCARGGLRSQISQQWLLSSGIECKRIAGGFKLMRQFLLQYLDDTCSRGGFTLLSGMTGTGKTDILKTLNTSIDLEGHANHKGSSFGRQLSEQPAQIDFENNLTIALLNVREKHCGKRLILEDESRNIGGLHLPVVLSAAMATSDMVVIDLPIEERIEKLWQEYVVQRYAQTLAHYHVLCQQGEGEAQQGRHSAGQMVDQSAYQNAGQDLGEQAFADHLYDSLLRIQKRLGSERTKEILSLMKAALQCQHIDNFHSHKDWLRAITVDYYDPMYRYQLEKNEDRVVFRGNRQRVMQWLQETP
jgi:tRNA 2-selenouridine synthase